MATVLKTTQSKRIACDLQSAQNIHEEALALFWTLTPEVIQFIFSQGHHTPENLLRFAIQLCLLPRTGRFTQDYSQIPIRVVQYLARQLELEPVLGISQPQRWATEYQQRETIRNYLGFCYLGDEQTLQLDAWMAEQLKHEFYTQETLLSRVEAYLIAQKIILPAAPQLGRKVASVRYQIQQQLYEKIVAAVPMQTRLLFDCLLKVPQGHILSSLNAFKRSPPHPSAKVINEFIDRLESLHQMGVHQINLSEVPVNLVQDLYQLVGTYHAKDLRRMVSLKRHALLTCFLVESYKTLLDHVVALNGKLLTEKDRQSRHQFRKKLQRMRRQAREAEKIMLQTLDHVYSPQNSTLLISDFLTKLNNKRIQQAMLDCRQFHQYEESGGLQELANRYPNLRKYAPRFFQLEFQAARGSETLLKAINLLRQRNDGSLKTLPWDTPCHFVPANWSNALHQPDGTIKQRTWELALYQAVKTALDSGDLYLAHSRNHRNFWETTYTQKAWETESQQMYLNLKLPHQFDAVLKTLELEFEEGLRLAKQNLNKDSWAYIDKTGALKLRREDALYIPESTQKLRHQIESRLPPIRIEQLLQQVEADTHFSHCFVPPKEFSSKTAIPPYLLHAALIAHATNMGIYGMAHSVEGITLDELRNASRWLIHTDALKAANTHLVNAHLQLPLTPIYGDGRRSSSDGQRYGIRASSLLASYYPRYYGYYDKALSVYTHISNQYSIFNTQVISCGVREATYVLGGLVSNDSLLEPAFHSTDTHGFTHHIFALCFLLGFSFQPRLKDLAAQQLFKLFKTADYGSLNSLFTDSVDLNLIREQWDCLVRIAASIKNKLSPPHVIIQKLANRSLSDKAAKALLELGKIIKTIFILRYISDPALRHTVQLQLNRGEHRHALAQHVFFADQGIFKTNDYEEIMNKASCLSFVSNAILYWNTLQFGKIVNGLKAQGYTVADDDLARVSTLLFKHITVHGIYKFI